MVDHEIKLNDALKREHEKVFDYSTKTIKGQYRIDCNCHVCGSSDYKIYCIKDGFVHKRCKNCGLVYLSPKFTQEATIGFYNSEANEVYNEEKFHNASSSRINDDRINKTNMDILLSLVKDTSGKKLLEVGCGNGFFLKLAKESGFDVYGLELNDKLVENSRKITANIINKDLLEVAFPENMFDVIYMRDVIEHIGEPLMFLQEISRILKPGGLLFMDTHNIDSMINRFTKEFHTVIFAFEHPVHWSPKSLSYLCNKVGLKNYRIFQEHGHQTLMNMLQCIQYPSFTYIFKPQRVGFGNSVRKTLIKLLNNRFLAAVDYKLSRFISKSFGLGSTMKAVYIK